MHDKTEGPSSWARFTSLARYGACRARWAWTVGHGRNTEESLSYTPFKSHFQQRLSPQGYPGRPPTSSWPVVPLPRPVVDICRFSPLPAKSRCVTHQPPSSQLPATHITAASLHQHSASFISKLDAVSAYCSFTLLSCFSPSILPSAFDPSFHSDSLAWTCLRSPPSPC